MMQQSATEWRITAEERAKHDAQFYLLKPINGFVTGQSARQFFLQSNLPPAVLGQIWELADFNKDGRLDKLEFSIAMYLIKKKLENKDLPVTLPNSLMLQPSPMGFGGTQHPGMMGPVQGMAPMQAMQPAGFGGMNTGASPGYMPGFQPSMVSPLARAGTLPAQSAAMPGSPERSRSAAISPEWAIPQSSKLKYKQQFNQNDRMKSGFIMGLQARSILMQTGLPQNFLAQIWMLSDINGDGKLTSDEFVVAMHLVDMAKSGQTLPMTLPGEMVPPSFRRGRSSSFTAAAAVGLPPATGMSPANVMQQPPPPIGAVMVAPVPQGMLPKQESLDELPPEPRIMPVTFEDRKKLNFDKGQQELQRRRALLEEEQKKEKDRQMEIEKREFEKRERVRLEQERRKQMEMEKMLARQREIEAEQEEQRRMLIEQREAARRQMERMRQLDMEKQRKQELEARRIKEQGDVAHLKAKSKTLVCEMETLDDKKNLLMKELSEGKTQITEVNTKMILMGQSRDGKVSDIERIQINIQESRKEKMRLDKEKTELAEVAKKFAAENPMSDTYKTVMNSYNQKKQTCEALNGSLSQLEQETAKTLESIDESNAKLAELKHILAREEAELKRLQDVHKSKVTAYQHTKVNIQNQKKEQDTATTLSFDSQVAAVKQETSRAKEDPLADPFAAFREVQAEDEKKRIEAEKSTKEEEVKPSAGSQDIFSAFDSAPAKPVDPSDPFSALGGTVSSKPAEEKKDPFADFANFGSFEFSSTQPKATSASASVSSSTSLFAAAPTNTTSSVFDSDFKTDSTPAVEERQEEKKEEKKEVETVKAKVDVFSALSTEASQKSAPPIVSTANVHSAYEPPKQEGASTKESVSSLANKLDMMSIDVNQPLPEHLRAVLSRYRALFDFAAEGDDELSFKKGDIILVGKQQDAEPGWLGGELRGQTGWFPENHVQKMSSRPNSPVTNGPSEQKKPAVVVPKQEKTIQEPPPAEDTSVGKKSGSPFTHVTSTPLPADRVQAAAEPKPKQISVEALNDFEGKEMNHLSFKAGDVITVIEQQDMWWSGELRGKTGWFPKDLVKEAGSAVQTTNIAVPTVAVSRTVQEDEAKYEAMYPYASAESGDLAFDAGETIVVIKKDGEWWRGRIGDREGDFPSNYVKLKEMQPPELPPKTGSRKNDIAKVLAPYHATGKGQLSLTVGQVIMIRKKNDSGWWEGELQARGKKRQIGWFPANYVQLLPSKTSTLPKSQSPQSLSSPVPSDQRLTPGLEVVSQVITLYPYNKTKEDEISFQKGMVINVMSKEEGEWWKGELNGAVGYFPSNYVQELKDSGRSVPSDDWTKDIALLENTPEMERKRQERIHELIMTEEKYVADLHTAVEVFHKPLEASGIVSAQDLSIIFVNWKEIIHCNTKMLKAFRVRKKMSGVNQPIHTIGDILCEQLAQFSPYIRFCSCQLTASSYLHKKLQSDEKFNELVKTLGQNPRTAGMPLSSSLIKPMQRITKYPLLIQKVLKYTPESHSDYSTTKSAHEKAEELCNQVNEGVREIENSENLEWLQTHVECEGLAEELVFNSLTNCLGPRKYIHSGRLHKVKSNKELYVFLLNDFLLFTQPVKPGSKPFITPGNQKQVEFKMYKQPLFLNEVEVIVQEDVSSEDFIFHVNHGDRVYALRCDSKKELSKWMEAIESASSHYTETEKKKREKAQRARAERSKGVGRLMVVIIQGNDLKASNGVTNTSDPYCLASMGGQENKTKVVLQNLNPVWDSNMQFIIRDLEQDLLCITVYDKDLFTPDDYLGRTEVRISEIHKETQGRGPITKSLLLHEVDTGEISVKLNLHLFEDS
ncbi:intersectin-1-like isoform X2 [Apostichopus japonicus]|uniref:intersectin-1-like isoform X2 n=1 Tax=Stichopus japonicus TaxID=307972 RepID=UPI003AB3F21E